MSRWRKMFHGSWRIGGSPFTPTMLCCVASRRIISFILSRSGERECAERKRISHRRSFLLNRHTAEGTKYYYINPSVSLRVRVRVQWRLAGTHKPFSAGAFPARYSGRYAAVSTIKYRSGVRGELKEKYFSCITIATFFKTTCGSKDNSVLIQLKFYHFQRVTTHLIMDIWERYDYDRRSYWLSRSILQPLHLSILFSSLLFNYA